LGTIGTEQVMALNTIAEVLRPATVEDGKEWQAGCAWMAGGTCQNIDDVDADVGVINFGRSRKYQWNERNEN
jgi:hypothetical protein